LRAVVVAIALAAVPCAQAAPLRSAEPAPEEILRGEADGVGLTSKGLLFLSPKPRPLGEPLEDGTPAYVWSLAVDEEGRVTAGTGPDGKIVRGTASVRARVLASLPEPLVTAVASEPGGTLLAATAPEGRIYRVTPDGAATLWSETGERYIWALLPRPGGTVLAATGERGRLLRVDRSGHPTVLFDSDEFHLVSLVESRDGAFLAGGAGRGLVYRIEERGRATVLHDDELPEARSIAEDAAGNVFVAFLSPPVPERRLPAVRIQVGGTGQPGSEIVGEMEDRDEGTIRGVIEGLPGEPADVAAQPRGKIVRIAPDGAITELWRSSTEAAFAVAIDPTGKPIFGTGEPARLFRVERGDEVSLLATLREGQVTALARSGGGLALATSNPAALYRVDPAPGESGSFVSLPLDAGAAARWGSISWRTEGPAGRIEVSTRTGNSHDPDATWSDWSPGLSIAGGSAIPSPPGRYLQWRMRIFGGGENGGRIHPARATFATENRSPGLRDLRLDGSTPWIGERATFRWAAQDPDGDPVAVELEVRKAGESSWSVAARVDPAAAKPADLAGEPDVAWREGRAIWDATGAAEGAWEVRAVAHDRPSNPPGAGKEEAFVLPLHVTVDRTAPTLEARRDGGDVAVVARDTVSPVVRLEVLESGRVLFAPGCLDGVCDTSAEDFRFPAEASGGRSLRAFDAAGNVAEIPLP
jgi:hypothetical protein